MPEGTVSSANGGRCGRLRRRRASSRGTSDVPVSFPPRGRGSRRTGFARTVAGARTCLSAGAGDRHRGLRDDVDEVVLALPGALYVVGSRTSWRAGGRDNGEQPLPGANTALLSRPMGDATGQEAMPQSDGYLALRRLTPDWGAGFSAGRQRRLGSHWAVPWVT